MPRALPVWLLARFAAACLALAVAAPVLAKPVLLVTTEAIAQSGLPKALAPKLKQALGLDVQVQSRPAAQALDAARKGEVDVLLLDDPQADADKLVAQGFAARAVPVMTTELLLVGPKGDPAGAAGKDIRVALGKVDSTRSLFISRGDQSIVHVAEQRLWTLAGAKGRKGGSHRECKCGMGGALDIAATAFGYTLTDRAAWLAFRNRVDLVPLVEGDPRLTTPYAAFAVNHARQLRAEPTDAQRAEAAARTRDAQKVVQWFASPVGRAAIQAHLVHGQPLFTPVPGK